MKTFKFLLLLFFLVCLSCQSDDEKQIEIEDIFEIEGQTPAECISSFDRIQYRESLYTAIIPAVAGIIGVILGFFTNTFSKYFDNKDKRRQKQIESFESYYNPLVEKLHSFLCHIDKLKKKISVYDLQLNYSLLVNTDRSEFNPEINTIKIDVTELLSLLSKLNYRYSGDFKVEFFRDKTFEFLIELEDAIKTNKKVDKIIPLELVEKLIAQIGNMIYPSCWIYRKYLQYWKKCQIKKYTNQ